MLSFSSHARIAISSPSVVKSFLRAPLTTSFRFSLPIQCLENKNRRKKCNSRLYVVQAKMGKKGGTNSGQFDDHSFVPKPDESTGPFPEAVLLKKKSVQEDGRVLPDFADSEEEELFDFLSLQLESDLNVDRVRHYEVVYLIHEDYVNEVEGIISEVQDFIRERKGRIWRLNNWGMRRLAYKIKKARKANYILMNFELEAKCVDEFKLMLDKNEKIIRHLVIKRDEAITDDCPPPIEFHTLVGGMDDDDEDTFDADAFDEDAFDEDAFDDDDDGVAFEADEGDEQHCSHPEGKEEIKIVLNPNM